MTKKEKDIRKLMAMTGTKKVGDEILFSMFANATPDKNFNEIMREEVSKIIDFKALDDLLVKIYDKHFTHEDIKYVIAFYETPIGSKFISQMPSLTRDISQAGYEWAETTVKKMDSKLLDIIEAVSTRYDSNNLPSDIYPLHELPSFNEQELIEARHKFVLKYIKQKGWGKPETLTASQIMEIKSQPEWKDPIL